MLTTYPPRDDEKDLCSADSVWIDLLNPIPDEEKAVEKLLGIGIPTRTEMAEIETSNRLYVDGNAVFMTANILTGFAEGAPSTAPVTFVLTPERLVTLRYDHPVPFKNFTAAVAKNPALAATPAAALVHLLEAIVERLADILEGVMAEVEQISGRVFRRNPHAEGRIPTTKLQLLLTRVGRIQTELAKGREAGASLIRLVNFLHHQPRFAKEDPALREALQSVAGDLSGLADTASFVSGNVNFLLDASLGLISIEQNAIIKIFSVAAVIFLPPTLVASIYGMNFKHMPELDWHYGYPMAIALMVMSAILPYLFFRKKGWL